MGYLGLQVMIGGALDVYRIPITRTAFAQNGYQMKLDPSNSVIILITCYTLTAYLMCRK